MNLNLQDKIDRYLQGQMPDEEKKAFEAELDLDGELRTTVKLQRLIVREIKLQSFREMIREAEEASKAYQLDEEEANQHIRFSLKASKETEQHEIVAESTHLTSKISFFKKNQWAIAIAASVIGIILVLWQPFKSSNSSIYNSYLYAYDLSGLSEAESVEQTRGGTFYFANFNPADNEILMEALDYYEEKQYGRAKELFEQVLVQGKGGRSKELKLYMAVTQLYTADIDKALQNLQYLHSLDNFKLKAEGDYYLALAYIKTGKVRKARKLLKQIKEEKGKYSERAAEMLKELRWF